MTYALKKELLAYKWGMVETLIFVTLWMALLAHFHNGSGLKILGLRPYHFLMGIVEHHDVLDHYTYKYFTFQDVHGVSGS